MRAGDLKLNEPYVRSQGRPGLSSSELFRIFSLDVQHAKQHQQHDNRQGHANEPKQNGHVNTPCLSRFVNTGGDAFVPFGTRCSFRSPLQAHSLSLDQTKVAGVASEDQVAVEDLFAKRQLSTGPAGFGSERQEVLGHSKTWLTASWRVMETNFFGVWRRPAPCCQRFASSAQGVPSSSQRGGVPWVPLQFHLCRIEMGGRGLGGIASFGSRAVRHRCGSCGAGPAM